MMEFSARERTKKLVLMALFAALAVVCTLFIHIPLIPAAPFLTYEPKDMVLALSGMILGPGPAAVLCVLVPLIEFLVRGATGPIGFAMNMIAAFSFVMPISLIYAKKGSFLRLLTSICIGTCSLTVLMLLWNILLTPIYSGIPREQIISMLVPVFLPFNLIKGLLNGGLILLVYRPLFAALRRARVLPPHREETDKAAHPVLLSVAVALTVLALCVIAVLFFNHIIHF